MPKLIVKTGDRAGMEYEVRDGMILGRRLEVPVHIEDVKSSREHAKIVAHGDGFVLFDLESTNGTFVNGSRTGRTRMNHGDIIRIGRTEIIFHDPTAVAAATPAGPVQEKPQTPVAPAQKKIDFGRPPPKKLKLDLPPPKKVNVKLQSTRPRRDKRK
jgi:pSer/pThr/pTyr-binding forkhead associated (FHA) protein